MKKFLEKIIQDIFFSNDETKTIIVKGRGGFRYLSFVFLNLNNNEKILVTIQDSTGRYYLSKIYSKKEVLNIIYEYCWLGDCENLFEILIRINITKNYYLNNKNETLNLYQFKNLIVNLLLLKLIQFYIKNNQVVVFYNRDDEFIFHQDSEFFKVWEGNLIDCCLIISYCFRDEITRKDLPRIAGVHMPYSRIHPLVKGVLRKTCSFNF